MLGEGSRGPLAIVLYSLLSPLLTWVNKRLLLQSSTCGVTPELLVFLQQFCGCIFLWCFQRKNVRSTPQIRHVNVFVMALCFVCQLTLCNTSLRNVPLTSYQAGRSSSLIFSMMVQKWVFRKPIGMYALECCSLVAIGFVIAVWDTEQTFSYIGMLSSVMGSLIGVTYMSLCHHVAQNERVSQTEIVYHIAFTSSVFLVPILAFQYRTAQWQYTLMPLLSTTTGILVMLSVVLSPVISLTTVVALSATTPLTCTVSGFAKSALQAILGNWLFGDPLTLRSILGVCLCLCGCAGYSAALIAPKNDEKQKKSVETSGQKRLED